MLRTASSAHKGILRDLLEHCLHTSRSAEPPAMMQHQQIDHAAYVDEQAFDPTYIPPSQETAFSFDQGTSNGLGLGLSADQFAQSASRIDLQTSNTYAKPQLNLNTQVGWNPSAMPDFAYYQQYNSPAHSSDSSPAMTKDNDSLNGMMNSSLFTPSNIFPSFSDKVPLETSYGVPKFQQRLDLSYPQPFNNNLSQDAWGNFPVPNYFANPDFSVLSGNPPQVQDTTTGGTSRLQRANNGGTIRAPKKQSMPELSVAMSNVVIHPTRNYLNLVPDELARYSAATNRLAFGERQLLIHTPRVGQKSYGTEKRFLCPPPIATIIGRTWWTPESRGPRQPPKINIRLSDESAQPDSAAQWITTTGQIFEGVGGVTFQGGEEPFVGRAPGKNLHISDSEEKKQRVVKALVTLRTPASSPNSLGPTEIPVQEQVLGQWESKEIKIISKPGRRRQITRNSELNLTNGTTVCLYSRIRGQTNSTRYLTMSPSVSRWRGSDDKPLVTGDQSSLSVDASVWDPFHIWLVDPVKSFLCEYHQPTPAQPNIDGRAFEPPPDAILTGPSTIGLVIAFNNCVRLQCGSTGAISDVFVVRRVENQTTVTGSGGIPKEGDPSKCPVGEYPAEPVLQLHKIALERYDDPTLPVWGQDCRNPGKWLTSDGQNGIWYSSPTTDPGDIERRQRMWEPKQTTPPLRSSVPVSPANSYNGLLPMTPRTQNGMILPHGAATVPVSPNPFYSPTNSVNYGVGGSDYFSPNGAAAARKPSISSSSSSSIASHASTAAHPYWNGAVNATWEDMGGVGPDRNNNRRRTSSNASVLSMSGYGLPTVPTPMSPPVALPMGGRMPRKHSSGDVSVYGGYDITHQHQQVHPHHQHQHRPQPQPVHHHQQRGDSVLWKVDVNDHGAW